MSLILCFYFLIWFLILWAMCFYIIDLSVYSFLLKVLLLWSSPLTQLFLCSMKSNHLFLNSYSFQWIVLFFPLNSSSIHMLFIGILFSLQMLQAVNGRGSETLIQFPISHTVFRVCQEYRRNTWVPSVWPKSLWKSYQWEKSKRPFRFG